MSYNNNGEMDSKQSKLRSEEVHEEDNKEEDFTFATSCGDSAPISAVEAFENGKIRPIYPLFDQNLLLNDGELSLPARLPVEHVFIESQARKSDEMEGIATGPYRVWSKSPEMSRKSNSTGSSKLWRSKEYTQRSNSDGRDAYVFFNQNSTGEVSLEKNIIAKKSASEKKAVVEEKKKAKKGDKTMSSLEVYFKNKGYNPEEKRKSYLPYRPELVGFFTNVNGGGLSKNVHPY